MVLYGRPLLRSSAPHRDLAERISCYLRRLVGREIDRLVNREVDRLHPARSYTEHHQRLGLDGIKIGLYEQRPGDPPRRPVSCRQGGDLLALLPPNHGPGRNVSGRLGIW